MHLCRHLAWIGLSLSLLGAAGCAPTEIPDLKSPCVAADIPGAQNPCGPRRPVNAEWLKKQGLPIPAEQS